MLMLISLVLLLLFDSLTIAPRHRYCLLMQVLTFMKLAYFVVLLHD